MSAPPAKKQRLSSMPAPTVAPGVPAIPIARVNKIIKADRDVRVCSKEAVFLIAKATVRFPSLLKRDQWVSRRCRVRRDEGYVRQLERVRARRQHQNGALLFLEGYKLGRSPRQTDLLSSASPRRLAQELMLGKLALQAYQNARMDKRQKMVRYTDLGAPRALPTLPFPR